MAAGSREKVEGSELTRGRRTERRMEDGILIWELSLKATKPATALVMGAGEGGEGRSAGFAGLEVRREGEVGDTQACNLSILFCGFDESLNSAQSEKSRAEMALWGTRHLRAMGEGLGREGG